MRCERNLDLLDALSGTSAVIEQQLLLSGFDEDAWPETIHPGLWGAGAQERYGCSIEVFIGKQNLLFVPNMPELNKRGLGRRSLRVLTCLDVLRTVSSGS